MSSSWAFLAFTRLYTDCDTWESAANLQALPAGLRVNKQSQHPQPSSGLDRTHKSVFHLGGVRRNVRAAPWRDRPAEVVPHWFRKRSNLADFLQTGLDSSSCPNRRVFLVGTARPELLLFVTI